MYEWKAIYNDGTFLRQFDDKESLFKDINIDKLNEFRLFDAETNNVISLFLDDGIFGLNGLILENELSYKKLKYKLIFFARRKRVLGNGNNSNDLFLGFQINENGNQKIMLKICEETINIVKE